MTLHVSSKYVFMFRHSLIEFSYRVLQIVLFRTNLSSVLSYLFYFVLLNLLCFSNQVIIEKKLILHFQHYNLKEMSYYTVMFGVSRALGVLSSLVS